MKYKVSAVSYLNTKPFLYGLLHQPIVEQIDLQLDIPSECARKLRDNEADIALVPVAIIPELEHAHIISDYCIGTEGKVATVCIFSDCPIEEVEVLFLDYHSRTSVELAKILLHEYWKLNPILLAAKAGFEKQIGGNIAAVIIGDRAIGLEKQYKYTYDLGELWHEHTGLPFVFAAWVSNKPLPPLFINQLNEALGYGLSHIPQLMYLIPSPHPDFDLEHYYTHNISYGFDTSKKEALTRFLKALKPDFTLIS